jgi:hypothetical protein
MRLHVQKEDRHSYTLARHRKDGKAYFLDFGPQAQSYHSRSRFQGWGGLVFVKHGESCSVAPNEPSSSLPEAPSMSNPPQVRTQFPQFVLATSWEVHLRSSQDLNDIGDYTGKPSTNSVS